MTTSTTATTATSSVVMSSTSKTDCVEHTDPLAVTAKVNHVHYYYFVNCVMSSTRYAYQGSFRGQRVGTPFPMLKRALTPTSHHLFVWADSYSPQFSWKQTPSVLANDIVTCFIICCLTVMTTRTSLGLDIMIVCSPLGVTAETFLIDIR